jgi:DNA polymerase I-like protein with 3'-5' exonuclease and polymerase domains
MGLELDTSFDNLILDAYHYVEQNGIGVIEEHIKSLYSMPNSAGVINKGIAYSYYNLYNLTGRPTNSFKGINFLAIPKEGDYRKQFIPTNDYFVEFDFDSYHLRLIAKLVGIELSNSESIHKMLASQYFEKSTKDITEEEYKQAKVITFRQLYGGVEPQYSHIEFLSCMSSYTDKEYKKYKAQSSYVLPTGRILKKHSAITKHKLFNYILQNLETKTNVEKILKIKKYLKDKKTKLILITYDAFLFDFSVQDGKEALIEIKDILQQGEFPVKHTYGINYSFS